jgi:hypothetical protein
MNKLKLICYRCGMRFSSTHALRMHFPNNWEVVYTCRTCNFCTRERSKIFHHPCRVGHRRGAGGSGSRGVKNGTEIPPWIPPGLGKDRLLHPRVQLLRNEVAAQRTR